MKIGWYKNSYRRNLVDMHIEDWNDEFLSKLSAEDYLDNLKRGKIKSAMIYFQNHNGHCYFPTKVGHVHRAFEKGENQIKKLVDLCHENDIDVVGYYSLIYNTYEEDKHKDWRLYGKDGLSARERGGRYGHLCPNNPEYREFIKVQIKEMLDYFDVDGMFYDMTFWPQLCNCEYCRARWKAETGLEEMPFEVDYKNDLFKLHMRKRREWIGEFAKFVTSYTYELQPGITVEHNYANSVAGGNGSASNEIVNDWCDYTGGDLYGNLYNHSFAAKYYRGVTKNQPYEYMTCRCDMNLQQHTVTKSEAHLETEIMMNVANHAATLIIDAIDPRGTMDKRVYDRIGKIFDKEMQYESRMVGKPITDLGIMYFTGGRYNSEGQVFDNKSASVSAVRTMIENNFLFDVVAGNRADLTPYKCVLAPAVACIEGDTVEKIAKYVENGGNFYFSGAEEPELIKRLLGADYVGMSDYRSVYVAPKNDWRKVFGEFNRDFPFPVNYRLPVVKNVAPEDVMAYITLPYTNPDERKFASIHSNPPGVPTRIPAVVCKKVGKGRVIWSAAPIEQDERVTFRALFARIVSYLLPKEERSLLSDAHRQAELVCYDLGDCLQVNAVDVFCTDERLALPNFKVSLKCDSKPEKVRSVTKDKDIPFTYSDGYVKFNVRSLKMFEMFEIVK